MSGALILFLAAMLATSALHKVLARGRLAPVAAKLAHAAPGLGLPLLLAAAAIEGLTALGLMVPLLRPGAALAAAALWLGYCAALLVRRGQVLDCGCDLFSREKPVDAFAILRPLLLAGLALSVAFAGPAQFPLDAPFAALALLALWFAAGELSTLPHLARISRR